MDSVLCLSRYEYYKQPCCSSWHAKSLQGWLEGEGSKGDLTICDVRDVARAHIAAVEKATASGRYIISDSHCISSKFVSDTFKVGVYIGRASATHTSTHRFPFSCASRLCMVAPMPYSQARFPQLTFPAGDDLPHEHRIDNSKVGMGVRIRVHALVYVWMHCCISTCVSSLLLKTTQAMRELNIHPIKPEVTLVDMAVTLLQLGLAAPKA